MDLFITAASPGNLFHFAGPEEKKIWIDSTFFSTGRHGIRAKAKKKCLDYQKKFFWLVVIVIMLDLFAGCSIIAKICRTTRKKNKNSQKFPDRCGYFLQHGANGLDTGRKKNIAMAGC